MKKIKFLALLMTSMVLGSQVSAVDQKIVRPGPTDGKDAVLNEKNPNANAGKSREFISYYWSFSGKFSKGYSLIQFDLPTIPPDKKVLSAELSLYYDPLKPGSAGQDGNNACYLKKVTSSWDEDKVTWNTMPSTSTAGQVLLGKSPKKDADHPNIDITQFVKDWYTNPSKNYGMMLEVINSTNGNSMKFASSDHPDSTLRPKLVIRYSESADTCISMKLDPLTTKDVLLKEQTPSKSNGQGKEFISYYWSFSGTFYEGHSLMQLDLPKLPSGSKLVSASLSLYHSPPPGSAGQSGNNACYLKKVTSAWDEDKVSWNSMPSTSLKDQVYLAESTSETQDYLNIDISQFVEDWYADPSKNFGMMLQVINNTSASSMKFASSDHPDTTLRPVLEVCFVKAVGTAKVSAVPRLAIYPNPSKGLFNVNWEGDGVSNSGTLSIANSLGQSVFHEKMNNHQDMNRAIDLSHCQAGIYFIRYQVGEKSIEERLLIE